jgi:hypothetical protein
MRRTLSSLLTGLFLTSGLFGADPSQDLSKIDRRIGRQPKYVAEQPLYGMVVIGPKMKTRMWMVLDKSAPSQSQYDVVFADLNGNGDLTDDGERITTEVGKDGESRFKLPDVTDPDSADSHTEFSLRCSPTENPYQMVSVKWKGKQKFGGGYTDDPDKETYSQFATSPDKAPILWLNGDGPFTFQRWYVQSLQIGGETDVKLFIGVAGVGKSTFCAFQVHALPEGEGIQGTLRYTTKTGEQRESAFALLNKC